MAALSSSFITSIPLTSSNLFSATTTSHSSSRLHLLRISSVGIEEKPTTPKPTTSKTKPPSIATSIFSALDGIINDFIDPPLRPSVNPKYVLQGNFAPVDELPPTPCDVIQGKLPSCLDGAYIRNGPNPQYLPRGPYHLFEGDGMLHSIRISQGQATLCSRYVKTNKYQTELRAGAPVMLNLYSGFSSLTASAARGAITALRFLAGEYNLVNGIGLANTSLAFLGNRLYALCESDLPYQIRLTPNGDIETLDRDDFDGKLTVSMTAHPKIDPKTGEAFAFRCGLMRPFLAYFRFDSDGKKQQDVPIFSVTRPSFIHDFAITEKYAIFADIQIKINPMEMIVGGGSPVAADPAKVSRIGVIPKYAADESVMGWFDVPGFNPLHTINAWDEKDAIVLLASNILSVEHVVERMELVHGLVEKVRIDLRTGLVTRKPVSARNLEFGVINPSFLGKKNRFVYAAVWDRLSVCGGMGSPKTNGVVKLDISGGVGRECIVASRMYGTRCYGGEPFFVAREPENPEAEEDDGYLVSYVHDEINGESSFLVMDAKSPELEIVAVVRLPSRVPYGLHGIFVRESILKLL